MSTLYAFEIFVRKNEALTRWEWYFMDIFWPVFLENLTTIVPKRTNLNVL